MCNDTAYHVSLYHVTYCYVISYVISWCLLAAIKAASLCLCSVSGLTFRIEDYLYMVNFSLVSVIAHVLVGPSKQSFKLNITMLRNP